ncbi:MAG: hypothetical protein J6S85_04250 [Methanobrevibacter sp.]|nr:hypothetical protein [Methanobrevibacter sp.]
MNETLEMIEIIRNNAKQVRLENLKKAELKRKEDKNEKVCMILVLVLFSIGALVWLNILFSQYLVPMFF